MDRGTGRQPAAVVVRAEDGESIEAAGEHYFRDVHSAVAAGEDLTVDLLAELRGHYATDSL